MPRTGESPVGVRWGTDLAEGVRGADFVVGQPDPGVGGMEARHRDELLGHEFGLIGQETVGVGGFANALRTIRSRSITSTMAREAPDAMLFNFTNPAGLVTEALCRHTDVPTIGLCNVPWGVKSGVANGLGVPFDSIELDYVGLNHLSWVRGFRVDGVDVTDRVLGDLRSDLGKRTRRDAEPDWDDETIAFLHAMPNYYLLYYYETAAMLAHQAATPTRAAEVMELEAGAARPVPRRAPRLEAARARATGRRVLLRDGAPRSWPTCGPVPARCTSSTCRTKVRFPACPTTWSSRSPPARPRRRPSDPGRADASRHRCARAHHEGLRAADRRSRGARRRAGRAPRTGHQPARPARALGAGRVEPVREVHAGMLGRLDP